jgi:hypothetical protein
MELWLIPSDRTQPVSSARKLSASQLEDARQGRLFLARATSPVFAKMLAQSMREYVGDLHAANEADLEKAGLWRRSVDLERNKPVPVYEVRLFWPTPNQPSS